MARDLVIGVDIGTASTKGVLVGLDGRIHARGERHHAVARPRPGHVEMDAATWWQEFVELARELVDEPNRIAAVGVSGMGPCVLLVDAAGVPVRPAILYGVDTRATAQIARLERDLGAAAIMARGHAALSSQAVGPKLAWVAEHEPEAAAAAERLFMPSSWLGWNLTGRYVLDHHSASQCWPLYDAATGGWYEPWAAAICPWLELPPLAWPGDVVGGVTTAAAAATGLGEGTPVIAGTIDAWSEAVSVGADGPGDLMLMYGSTMFLVATSDAPMQAPALWGTAGVAPGTYALAGGMATSGAITAWLRDLVGGVGYEALTAEAEAAGPGANGLLLLPYFAGERTPIQDPDARGLIAGLTLSHTRGDLYRAALEATAFGVRHNLEAMAAAGARIDRVVAVGGGARSPLWPQIVSDVTGRSQVIPTEVVGASLGAALLAARTLAPVRIDDWNPPRTVTTPDPALRATYDRGYDRYRRLYPATVEIVHGLADEQRRAAEPGPGPA